MCKEDVYFQFPIKALNMGKSIEDVTEEDADCRFQEIVSYCLASYGKANFDKAGERHAVDVAVWYSESDACQSKVDLNSREHAEIVFAASRLGVQLNGGSMESHCKCFKKIANLEGGNMQVRFRRDIFWDYKTMGWREWSMLAGMYAMLGNRKKVRLSYKQINALALGYDKPKQLGDNNTLETRRMTDRKTQITVNHLARRNLFSKVYDGRHNWYSWKPEGVLEKMLVDRKAMQQHRKQSAMPSEQAKRMQEQIEQRVKELGNGGK